jgi:hypothetical protein
LVDAPYPSVDAIVHIRQELDLTVELLAERVLECHRVDRRRRALGRSRSQRDVGRSRNRHGRWRRGPKLEQFRWRRWLERRRFEWRGIVRRRRRRRMVGLMYRTSLRLFPAARVSQGTVAEGGGDEALLDG